MKLTVGKSVRDAVADPQTEELAFRVIASLPTNELLDRVAAALTVFEREWDRDARLGDSEGPVPAPDYAVSTAAPDVIVSLVNSPIWLCRSSVSALRSPLSWSAWWTRAHRQA